MLGSCHILAPNMSLAFNRLHMLSPEGACKAFDAAGNGWVPSPLLISCVMICLGLPSTYLIPLIWMHHIRYQHRLLNGE